MRKPLGQHFLIRKSVVHKILAALDLKKEDRVLEIGPGKGALTGPLARRVGKLLLVEKDPHLAAEVQNYFTDDSHVEILAEDFLALPWKRLSGSLGEAFKTVSNLPYQSGTAIFIKLLKQLPAGALMVLMFQKEVGERLLAKPRTKAYGSLSVMTQVIGEGRLLFEVEPNAFRPPPKVWSVVLKVKIRKDPLIPQEHWDSFEGLLQAGFSHRRKMLRQNLRTYFSGEEAARVEARLESLGAAPTARAEELSVVQWVQLFSQNP
ncbi:MAG: 16S rRNA (adenine(1518)-N(6)/adenine(1519)-N(6))-dimethyltransferase RsmA [bacterium]|nr:16S rRNA (adenine(1518)-N(6)/adenine(1519)-N(6))-dimethyltransferase RsmA [bacterium]